MGPEAQQRQHSVFSVEHDNGVISLGVLVSTISQMVIALLVVRLDFPDRAMVDDSVYLM